MKKFSTAMGSALPDPVASEARLSPVPVPAIENKTAPGQRGPVGLSPRTTYSRVNTGTPPVPDAGMSAQKSAPPRGSEFLPNKLAHQEVFMATSADRPSLNDMVKAAMAGTIAKSEITREALRQTGEEFSTKIASAQFSDNHVSTQDVHKLASALGYLAGTFRKEAYDLGPGAGPGSLEVSAPKASGTSLDAGESGHAIASNQPPMTPALQAEKAQSGKANTGLEDNMKVGFAVTEKGHKFDTERAKMRREHALDQARLGQRYFAVGHYDKEGNNPASVGNALRFRSGAADHPIMEARHQEYVAKKHGKGENAYNLWGGTTIPVKEEAHAKPGFFGTFGKVKDKKASANFSRLMRMGDEPVETGLPIGYIRKLAAEGPDSSASGEGVLSEPGDVTSQKNMIASNMAAINYTRREAKAGAKRDVNKYLDQPALTAAGDAVLARSLEHTNSAGAKIAGVKVPRQFTVGPTGAAKVEEMYAGAKKGLQRYGGLLKGGDREALAATANKAEQALKGNKVGKNKLNLTKGLSAATDASANENRAVNIARGATAGGALAAGGLYAATRNKESSADFSKVAAARALLSNLIEKVAEEQDGKKKTKEAVVPLNISSPSDSSGFQAQQLK